MQSFQSERLIDKIIEECAVNCIGQEDLNLALLQMIATSMRTTGETEHQLSDEDGVLLLRVELYE